MPLIIIIVSLIALKYFEIGSFFTNMSWWWIAGLMAIAFIWFEFLERMFGLDKRKAHEELEKIKKERVKKTFDKNNRPGR
jgi:small Trp-rich protein